MAIGTYTPQPIVNTLLEKTFDKANNSLNVSLVSGTISAGDITVSIPQADEDVAAPTSGTIIGFEARSTQKTPVDEGDYVIAAALLTGEQIFAGYNYSTGHIDVDNEVLADSYDAVNTAIKVNVVSSSASTAIATGAGATDADTTRIVAATDSPDIALLTTIDADTGSILTNQTSGSQKTQIVDGAGNVIASTSNALDVNVASGVALSVDLSNVDDDILVYGFDGAANQKLKTDTDGHAQVDVLSSALPTGAATEATLSTLNGKVTACNTGAVIISSQPALSSVSDSISAVQSGTWNINNVAGTISLPTGAATEATLNAIKTAVELLDNTVSGTELQVDVVSSALPAGAATSANQQTDALTDTQLRATPVPVSGTVTANLSATDNAVLDNIAANQTNASQKTQIVDGDGDIADVIAVNGNNGLVTLSPGHVSTANSTTTPLAGGAVFTGTAEDVTNFGVIQIMVTSSHDSATDGLAIEFSVDGTNWDSIDSYTIPANTPKVYSFQPCAKYYRIVYTNGSTLQTFFRLQTTIKPYYVKPSSHRIDDVIDSQDDAELVKAVLTAQTPGGTFVPIDSTASGNLKMSVQEISDGLDIGAGNAGTETQRVSISTDDVNLSAIKTAVELIDNAIAGTEMQVDVVTQPALSSVTDSVSAVQSGTWNINNISGAISLPTGAATESTLSTLNGKVTACDTGDVTVSSALPAGTNNIGDVDVASLPGTVAADITAIKTAVEILDNAISGTEMQVDVLSSALPTGAATESTLSTLNGKVAECNTGAVTINSMPDLSSASDSVAAVQSGTWNITNVSGTVSLPTGAATETTLASALTALQIMDDWDETNRAAVNLISSQTGVDGGNGAVSAATQRVTLASDSPGLATYGTAMPSAGLGIGGYATDTRKVAVDLGDLVQLVTNLHGELVTAYTDWVSGTARTVEQDPLDSRDVYPVLADITNGTDGTYYYYLDMARFRQAGIQLILDGGSDTVTATIEGTMQDDGTAAASCSYNDVSALWGAANWVADAILTDGDNVGGQFKYLRIKIVAASGDDTADWTIYGSKTR